jgi:ribosomal protein S18 acetylase RimI-like enzyme
MKTRISYSKDKKPGATEFIDLLKRSGLDLRRPVNEPERIENMLLHANLLICAWREDQLIGVARSLTDFSFCTYLSDLAVDVQFQKQGIGKELIRQSKLAAPQAKLILLSAPAAVNYYPVIGMTAFAHCFVLDDVQSLSERT